METASTPAEQPDMTKARAGKATAKATVEPVIEGAPVLSTEEITYDKTTFIIETR